MSKMFCIGLNGADDNLEKLIERFKDSIYEFFSAPPPEFFEYTARAKVKPATKASLKTQILKAHNANIKFNVLLNAACLSGNDFDIKFYKKIYSLIDLLVDLKVDYITITNTYLAEKISSYRYNQNYNFGLVISSWADIRDSLTAERFMEFLQEGDRIIAISNRTLRSLERIIFLAKSKKIKIEVIVNTGCLYKCNYANNHKVYTAHKKQCSDAIEDYYKTKICIPKRIKNPLEIVMAPTIRPEDLWIYKSLGVNYFKISGREFPTEWMLDTIEAYVTKQYKGNISDLCEQNNGFKMPYIPNDKLGGLLKIAGYQKGDINYKKFCNHFYYEKILNYEFHEKYMQYALLEGKKSTTVEKVGCIIVYNNSIISKGHKTVNDDDVLINTLDNIDKLPKNSIIYITHEPSIDSLSRINNYNTTLVYGISNKLITDYSNINLKIIPEVLIAGE